MALKAEPHTLRFSAFKLVTFVSAFIAWEAVLISNAASRWTPAALNAFLTGRGGEKVLGHPVLKSISLPWILKWINLLLLLGYI